MNNRMRVDPLSWNRRVDAPEREGARHRHDQVDDLPVLRRRKDLPTFITDRVQDSRDCSRVTLEHALVTTAPHV